MTKTTRIFRTWARRVEAGVFSRYQCLQWAKAVVPLSDNQESSTSHHGKKTILTPHEARGLRTALNARGGVNLTVEHNKAGFEWLQQNRRDFPDRVLDLFDRFSFQGDALDLNDKHDCQYSSVRVTDDGICGCGQFRDESGRWIGGTWVYPTAYYVPVWRIHMLDGGVLDYCNTPWQATWFADKEAKKNRIRLLQPA